MQTVIDITDFAYVKHQSGVHEFILKSMTRKAVHEMMVQLDEVVTAAPKDKLLRWLIDARAGIGYVAYAMQESRELMHRHPNPIATRVAILYKDNLMLSLAASSIHLLRPEKAAITFYKGDLHDEAMQWLLRA